MRSRPQITQTALPTAETAAPVGGRETKPRDATVSSVTRASRSPSIGCGGLAVVLFRGRPQKAGSKVFRPGRFSPSVANVVDYRAASIMQTG